MTPASTGTPPTPKKSRRERTRGLKRAPQVDGSLPQAVTQLKNAVYDLTHRRAQLHTNHLHHTDSRYTQLRDALAERGHGGHSAPASMLPTWVDALKLAIHIDNRTHAITAWAPHCAEKTTPARLTHLVRCKFRPQDSQRLESIAAEITSWSQAIDDLFAPNPIYLRGEYCPRCQQSHAHMKTDDGQTVTRPALVITALGIAMCGACHDTFPSLRYLGIQLGYEQPEGVTA